MIQDHDNYDIFWKQWVDCGIYGPTMRHQRRNIERLLKGLRFSSVIDIGGGSGENLHRLLQKTEVKEAYLLDISAEALERARSLIPQANFIQLDIEKNTLNHRFDLVLCCDVLEHINNDMDALENIRKLAAKYLIVSTLSGRMRPAERCVGHVRNYALEELENKLLNSGFRSIRTIKWGFPFYSPLYRNIWDLLPQQINYGEFGVFRKTLAHFLYLLFIFNSSLRGDYLFILAEVI